MYLVTKGKIVHKIKGCNKDSLRAALPGGRFNMDFGFTRGKTVTKNESRPLITSKEEYSCYLLITDEYSRYLWIFIFANTSPSVETVTTFLNTHGLQSWLQRVRTDLGGKLTCSTSVRKFIQDKGYTLETTDSVASFKNVIVQRPHRNLTDMMQTIFTGENLQWEYWSRAIWHAVYIKNRLPYQRLPRHITPFQRLTDKWPDITHSRVLGSHVTVRQTKMRRYKLDMDHATTGTFLGFTATGRTLRFEDHQTGQL